MDLKKDCVSHRKEFELYFCSGGGQLVTGQSCFDTIPYSKFGHVNIDFREHFSCAFQAFLAPACTSALFSKVKNFYSTIQRLAFNSIDGWAEAKAAMQLIDECEFNHQAAA